MTKDRLTIVRIVDDNDEYRNSETFLLRMFGYSVVDYPSALDFLEKDDPAIPGCLILDVKMPEMSGLELQKVMTEKELGLPIIFLTGHGDVEMAVNTLHHGASDFLLKPVAPVMIMFWCSSIHLIVSNASILFLSKPRSMLKSIVSGRAFGRQILASFSRLANALESRLCTSFSMIS